MRDSHPAAEDGAMEKKVDWQTAYEVANADIYRLLEAAGLGEPHVGTVEQAVDAIIRFREEAKRPQTGANAESVIAWARTRRQSDPNEGGSYAVDDPIPF